MDFNGFFADDIEYTVGFDNKNTIAGIFELVISWYVTNKWVSLKVDGFVKSLISFLFVIPVKLVLDLIGELKSSLFKWLTVPGFPPTRE